MFLNVPNYNYKHITVNNFIFVIINKVCIFAETFKQNIMAKKQVTWQLDPKLVDKIKARAKKNKVAIQVLAEELLTKGIEI